MGVEKNVNTGEVLTKHLSIYKNKMHIALNEAEKQEIKSKAYQTSNELYIGSIASFVGGVSLVISFISPYWLQSWEDTQSPFKKWGFGNSVFTNFVIQIINLTIYFTVAIHFMVKN